jgi:hypothetical protein
MRNSHHRVPSARRAITLPSWVARKTLPACETIGLKPSAKVPRSSMTRSGAIAGAVATFWWLVLAGLP